MLPLSSIPLTHLDSQTLLALLFWGNASTLILLTTYHHLSVRDTLTKLSYYYILAKVFQILAYFYLHSYYVYENTKIVYFGYFSFFAGYYLEAMSMLYIMDEKNKVLGYALFSIFLSTVVIFVLSEIYINDERVETLIVSLYLCFFFMIPSCTLFTQKNVPLFKKCVTVLYFCFASLMLPRGILALYDDSSMTTVMYTQSLTYLTLIVVLACGLMAYLLIIRENAARLIEKLATTDSLTGISNRHSFFDVATRVFNRQNFSHGTVSILFIDIDFFKKINDSYGHAFGDEVLMKLAETLRESVRPDDLICRYGGEEFLVLAAELDELATIRTARRIKETVESLRFVEDPSFRFSVSIGLVCDTPVGNDTLADFIERGDVAMYRAKAAGRNVIVAYRADRCLIVGGAGAMGGVPPAAAPAPAG
ncbi:MAG: GGDEF domain-containing protein [Desulfovibrio sp.]|jgi:diguanylate cyclase (GGDEF)-like protein|nr:GGDEF domain-containing protein [Desulfovibrio sp.]